MKKELEKHISDIFSSLRIRMSFDIFDCKVDALPDWTKHIQLTNEFFVCCQYDVTIKQRLHSFTGKIIFDNKNYLYWFEGESIVTLEQVEKTDTYPAADETIEYLKRETRLPVFLDEFIFNHLMAIYAPDFQRFDQNLNLTIEEINKYLGTYFPRSYAESFCIFDNIFQNKLFKQATSTRKSFNILSVGCGTGGDLFGLITVIDKYCDQISEINIWAHDGNAEALSVLEKIIERYRNQTSKLIHLETINSVLTSIYNFNIEYISKYKFDFVLSFKMICEIIAMGKGQLDNSYYDFIKRFTPLLSNTGLCVLLDVTTKPDHTTYNPILMNRQVNQALREFDDYSILLPLSCGLYGHNCYCDCFHQQTFNVTHQQYSNDKSKVAYKVIANKTMVREMRNSENNSKLLVKKGSFCSHTEKNKNIGDAYLLKAGI